MGDLFGSFTVLKDACFDGSVILHVSFLDEKSGKSSPEDGENSGAENAEWSNSVLEVKTGLTVLDGVVVDGLSWCTLISEESTWSDNVVRHTFLVSSQWKFMSRVYRRICDCCLCSH